MRFNKIHRATATKRFLLLFALFAFQLTSTFSQSIEADFETKLLKDYFTSLYNFSFHEADSLVIAISKTNPDKAEVLNIKANLAWWKLLSGDEIDLNLKLCNSNIDESIILLSDTRQQTISSLYNTIYAYSLKARLENYKGNRLKSIPYIYNSVGYMAKCLDFKEKDEKLYLALGLYLYFIDYFEDEYMMLNVFLLGFPDGDKEKGLRYLEECAASGNEMIKTEANYFLLKIFSEIDKDFYKASKNAQILTQLHPNNLVYRMEELKLLLAMGKSVEAETYKNFFLERIKGASTINGEQKNHFISQINELQKPEKQN